MASTSSTSRHFGPVPIQLLAAQLGIEGFDAETAEELSTEVEYRLRQIIQLAFKFMKHSKREVLTTEDIDCALRLWNVESLYGYSSSDPITFEKAEKYDDLFFVKDQVVSFQSILEESLPKCPPEPTFSVHWLAVEGQQPNVPQNPAFEHPLDTTEVDGEDEDEDEDKDKSKENDKQIVKQMVKHVLSKEQQMYYERVTDAIKGSNQALHQRILHSLANDPGLHQLLPYLIQFIADEVVHNLRELRLLISLMRMAEALLSSRHLCIEPYLHQLMSPLMTCLVSRHLCQHAHENHWALRDYAAKLIKMVCNRFGKTYQDLQPRITRQLNNAFIDATKPLTTHYGAIVGLAEMGDKVVEVTLLKHMPVYLKLLKPILNPTLEAKEAETSPENHRKLLRQNAARSIEARRCYGALLEAVGSLVRQRVYMIEYSKLLEKVSKHIAKARSGKRKKKSSGKKRSKTVDINGSEEDNMASKRIKAEVKDDSKTSDNTSMEIEKSDKKQLNGKRENSNGSTRLIGAGNSSSRQGVTWPYLYSMFGEQILPFSKVHLNSEDGEDFPSIGELFL